MYAVIFINVGSVDSRTGGSSPSGATNQMMELHVFNMAGVACLAGGSSPFGATDQMMELYV